MFIAAAALAGCSGQNGNIAAVDNETSANASIATAPPQPAGQSAPAQTSLPPLTADGWGPLRIGMTAAAVAAAMGPDSDPDAVGGAEPEACDQWRPARAPEGLLVMIENGRLTSISLHEGAPVRTDRGLGIGARAADVRRVYGPAVSGSGHRYQQPPAEYLNVWVRNGPRNPQEGTEDPNARGIVYEVDGNGVVSRISAGGPSIQYVEGCS